MPPLVLAIDTAFSRCTAAVFDAAGDGRLLASAEPEIGKGHAERLTGVIDEVLAEAGITYRDLQRIAVTTGPGSFTGIRVGVAAARGLALALDIQAVGMSTLDALANGAIAMAGGNAELRGGQSTTPVLAVIDARRGEVYAALYSSDGSALNGPAALLPADLPAFVTSAIAGGGPVSATALRLVGSGAAIAAAGLSDHDCVILDPSDRIDPETLARLGALAEAGEAPRPLYLRSADAKPSSAPSLRRAPTESIP
ncbi:tRNA (adenosine(37)-N6)-threonylcarbamoyltransferase complex dimerization subunit type 1 TsaB [Jiella endophytica]|uniref:tRNA (Adenosine(37)-N6)-threonylcarbamoyltransferase complex dimerization subunit type 1 TsaB n=1 Tax=Jiella endophytica TaxID=2558362 RepID=A0A4Y8RQ47_9HYPH|nr:tRNA (adenosine(37)-N6)-threonylcarbamoyltransferase complex dimerization subunit type 1 TsaB [Jiella endophytica]TFF25441.1 tRNA (adenosine(37)-N6)-threonylcarbamoyltransferase complex dimerization subunit type 1 TsaB [Jiella endophytica]